MHKRIRDRPFFYPMMLPKFTQQAHITSTQNNRLSAQKGAILWRLPLNPSTGAA